jgi:hypothetical protein
LYRELERNKTNDPTKLERPSHRILFAREPASAAESHPERVESQHQALGIGSRRALLASGVCLVVAGFSSIASAEAATAPATVQAQIVTRILPFERGFAGRAGNSITIVIAERANDADSASAATQIAKALSDIGAIGGKPLRTHTVTYGGAAGLVAESKKRGAIVVYLAPGLAGEVSGIALAFVESGVLTVAAVESYVKRGTVLGVEVADGKPRMSINLGQARKQKLDFPSAVLKLARVY